MRAVLVVTGCVLTLSAQTVQAGPASFTQMGKTGVFVFDTERSTVTQGGGIFGVHEVYPIQGQFVLTVDLAAHTASFGPVDANLIQGSPYLRAGVNLGVLFSMSELIVWSFKGDRTIEFQGEPNNGSWVTMTLSLAAEGARLTGRMFEGGIRCADCFTFDVNAVATYAYGGGRGEPNNPHLICTPEQMNAIGAEPSDWDNHFKLLADIDLGKYRGTSFNSIGYWVTAKDHRDFTGTFDGNRHTISNFTYAGLAGRSAGLWGYVSGSNAKIANVVLTEPNVSADINVGSLVGCLASGTVAGCLAKGGRVHGSYEVGGLVGYSFKGLITDCSADCNVSGSGEVGGLAGYCSGGAILRSVSGGSVTTNGLVGTAGGLVSGIGYRTSIMNCRSYANVKATYYVGGLIGVFGLGGRVANCYAAGPVFGMGQVGGLIGLIGYFVGDEPDIKASFWDVEATGQARSAGGTGKTTNEMQMSEIFLIAGWDLVDEAANGTEDLWWIDEGKDYPRLSWERMPAGGPAVSNP